MNAVRPLVHRQYRWLTLVCDAVLGKSADSIQNRLHDRIGVLEQRNLIDESLARQLRYIVSVRNSVFHNSAAVMPDHDKFADTCRTVCELLIRALNRHVKSIDWLWIDRESQKTNVVDIDFVVDWANQIEERLAFRFNAKGAGLIEKLHDARGKVSHRIDLNVRIAAKHRNSVIHDDRELDEEEREEFEEACKAALAAIPNEVFVPPEPFTLNEFIIGCGVILFVLACVVGIVAIWFFD